jgi:hypothetical protein
METFDLHGFLSEVLARSRSQSLIDAVWRSGDIYRNMGLLIALEQFDVNVASITPGGKGPE